MSNIRKIKILIFFLAVVGFLAVVVSVRATNNSVFSVSVWVRPATSVASKAIMGKAEEMRVATDTTGHPLCQIKATTWQTAVVSSQAISVNQWSHVVCTYDRVNFQIYINGILKGTQALTAVADDTAATWQLGRDASASTPYGNFTGLVDAYKFYTYVLGDDEIKTLYSGGSSLSMGGETASANNNGTTVTGENAKYCIPGDTAKCDKPVLELEMDEMSGATAFDKSGNGNNGTLNGATWNPVGKIGGALNFDGVDDYVAVAENSGLPLNYTSPNYSVSFWVKGLAGTNQFIFAESNHAETYPNFSMYKNSDKLGIRWRPITPTEVDSQTVVFDDKWHYISWIDNAGTASLYIDGKKDGANFNHGAMTFGALNRTTIGALDYNYTLTNFFNGQIDDVKVYNYARTPAQIAWDYNRGKPVAHWKMDEASGTQVDDWSGNANHGTMTNMDPTTDRVEGKNNKALDFDGMDDYVNLGSTIDNNLKNLSISAWVNLKNGTTSRDIISSDDAYNTEKGFEINIDPSEIIYFTIGQGNDRARAMYTPSVMGWHHLVATFDGTTARLFVDGIEGTSDTVSPSGSYSDPGENINIGRRNDPTRYFDSLIDEVKIYNYALTYEQIKSEYNSGAVIFQ